MILLYIGVILGFLIELGVIIYNKIKSPIIYQVEFHQDKFVDIPYCRKCRNKVAMLGLLSRETKKIQYHCSTCNKIIEE